MPMEHCPAPEASFVSVTFDSHLSRPYSQKKGISHRVPPPCQQECSLPEFGSWPGSLSVFALTFLPAVIRVCASEVGSKMQRAKGICWDLRGTSSLLRAQWRRVFWDGRTPQRKRVGCRIKREAQKICIGHLKEKWRYFTHLFMEY